MTILTERRVSKKYIGDGIVTDLPFDFKIFRPQDVVVYKADKLKAEAKLVYNNDYDVTLNPNQNEDAGGIVTLINTLGINEIAVVTTNAPSFQLTNLINQGGFYPDVINNTFDYLTILIQQLEEKLSRSIEVPITTGDPKKLAEGLLKLIDREQDIFDLARIIFKIINVADMKKEVVAVDRIKNSVTDVANIADDVVTVSKNDANVTTVATDTKKINTVAKNISDVNNFADVYLGSYAKKPATRNDGSPLETGDLYFDTVKKSIFVYDKSKKDWILISSVIRSLLKQFYFKATDKQTVFKGNDSNNLPLEFEENYLEIFLNGVHLNPEDFTLDSVNQTITLKEPARKDDELYIRSYGSFAFPDKEVKAILSIKTQIENLDKKKNELQAVFNSLTNINDLASIKQQIFNLEKIIADIKKLSAIDGAITKVSNIEKQIKTLTTNVQNIDTVAKLETQIKDILKNIKELGAIHTALPTIKTIENDLANVDAVAKELKTNIATVIQDQANIDKVANVDKAVKLIADNLQALLKATAGAVQATETTLGVAKVGTQKQVDDEKDDTVFVTPKKLINISKRIEYNSGKIEELETRDEEQQNLLDSNTLTASINKNHIAHLQTQQTNNTNDIVDLKNTDDAQLKLINKNNTAIAKIVADIKAGISSNKLKRYFIVPTTLYDKKELAGEEDKGAFGTAVAMTDKYLAISDPLSQEVVVYSRDKNNNKKWHLDEVHKGKQNEKISLEDGEIHIKNKDGIHVDVFTYDDTKTNLTFTKSQTINLNNSYGKSLAIDSNYLVVGVPQSKTALVYKHNGIQWRLVKELTGGDSFGSSVAVTDNYIIVAEPDNKKIEIFDLNYNKVKTITGGTSYSKLIDAYEDVFSVAEPDNNILKIYYDTTEIYSKTVKADCISLNHHKLLATSKTAKMAYLYNLYIKIRTGWFTTKNTTWQGLPNNTSGYTGYNIKGGQYQLVRPTGTKDTYTKYKGGSWVKNGNWGGVLFYDANKIGLGLTVFGAKTKITRADFEKIRNGVDGINLDNVSTNGETQNLNSVKHPLGIAFESGMTNNSINLKQSITAINQWVANNPSFKNGTLSLRIKYSTKNENYLTYKGQRISTGYNNSSIFFCIVILNKEVLYINMFTKKGSNVSGVIKETEVYNVITGVKAETMTNSPDTFKYATATKIVNDAHRNNPLGLLWFVKNKALTFESNGTSVYRVLYYPDAYQRGYNFYVQDVEKISFYLNTTNGKHYYNNKEVKDDASFDKIMKTVASLATIPDPIVQPNRNIKLTFNDIQEQPNKTGNYVSLLGTGTAITPTNIDDVSFPIDTNFGDACAVSDNEVMVANKTDNKLTVYDHKGTKIKDIQLDKDMGSVIDGTDKEVIVGSDTANKVEILDLK